VQDCRARTSTISPNLGKRQTSLAASPTIRCPNENPRPGKRVRAAKHTKPSENDEQTQAIETKQSKPLHRLPATADINSANAGIRNKIDGKSEPGRKARNDTRGVSRRSALVRLQIEF